MGKHKKKDKKHKKEKQKKEKKHHKRRKSSSSSSSSEEEWVEKFEAEPPVVETPATNDSTSDRRDEKQDKESWMDFSSFLSSSKEKRLKEREESKRLERERTTYNPQECSRELNPYWKDGGDGLPSFKKPSESENVKVKHTASYSRHSSSSWKKRESEEPKKVTKDLKETKKQEEDQDIEITEEVLSDKGLNMLGAKLIKAEIMGNTKLVAELKAKLDNARTLREKFPNPTKQEDVILTQTDSKGFARPLKLSADYSDENKRKKRRVETHKDGERVRYFADDDNYSLKEMFEKEKFGNTDEDQKEFIKLAGNIRKNDDMEEVFADGIRNKESSSKSDAREVDKAVGEHTKVSQSLETCTRCIQSDVMPKHLMICMGETMYLSLPTHEPLTEGHCLIVPIRHVTCGTQLDENEWTELLNFRKALLKMFNSKSEDVIFFETAMFLNKYPHMCWECIPVPFEQADLAPIYFKKAIDESETEWAQNKKLVSLKGRDVRKAVPKGLPYFCVSFGMQEGFAHVVEDQRYFPVNFAQEILGGMMDLDHSKWRKPKRQSFDEQSKRAVLFSKNWRPFDCTM